MARATSGSWLTNACGDQFPLFSRGNIFAGALPILQRSLRLIVLPFAVMWDSSPSNLTHTRQLPRAVIHVAILIEIIDTADEFCSAVESAIQDAAPLPEREGQELRLKLGLCRNLIGYVRGLANPEVENPMARDTVRSLLTAMIWVAYYARASLNYRLYRKLIIAEATFTHILAEQIPKYSSNGSGSHA